MSKQRRFKVDSLKNFKTGDNVSLPPDEAKHAKVLRLSQFDTVEIFDVSGLSATAKLEADGSSVLLQSDPRRNDPSHIATLNITLAVAWPKGKRASVLVQHCTEVGVSKIVPIKYTRTVVSKDDESEGVQRLKRIAAEAAKQCGRTDVPEILPEREYAEALKDFSSSSLVLVLDPRAELHLVGALKNRDQSAAKLVTLFIGPEGGFTDEELKAADALGVARVRMSQHVLRVETAAVAALSITAAILNS